MKTALHEHPDYMRAVISWTPALEPFYTTPGPRYQYFVMPGGNPDSKSLKIDTQTGVGFYFGSGKNDDGGGYELITPVKLGMAIRGMTDHKRAHRQIWDIIEGREDASELGSFDDLPDPSATPSPTTRRGCDGSLDFMRDIPPTRTVQEIDREIARFSENTGRRLHEDIRQHKQIVHAGEPYQFLEAVHCPDPDGTCRFTQGWWVNEEGRKTNRYMTFTSDGQFMFGAAFANELRPLYYGEGRGKPSGDKPILFVSGIMGQRVGAKCLPDWDVVANPFGDATLIDDPSPLICGQPVTFAPDDDDDTGSEDAMRLRMRWLQERGVECRWLAPHDPRSDSGRIRKPNGAPGGDIVDLAADETVTKEQLREGADPSPEGIERVRLWVEDAQAEEAEEKTDDEKTFRELMTRNTHFEIIGKDYLTEQAVFLTPVHPDETRLRLTSLTDKHLVSLAPVEWWEDVLTRDGSDKPFAGRKILEVISTLAQICEHDLPGYGEEGLGRGMAPDGRYNLGDRILNNDGTIERNRRSHSNPMMVRPALPELTDPQEGDDVLFTEMARELMRLRFNDPTDALLVLGWAAASVLKGGLEDCWFPHIQMVAPKASGKSFVRDLLARILGDYAKTALGSSSYAYYSFHYRSDALVWLIEEAEALGRNHRRINDLNNYLLECCGSGASAGRGTADQGTREAVLRASAITFSTSTTVKTGATEDRIITLGYGNGSGLDEDDFDASALKLKRLAGQLAGRMVSGMIHSRSAFMERVYGEHWEGILHPERGDDSTRYGGLFSEMKDILGDRRQARNYAPILAGLEIASGGLLHSEVEQLKARIAETHSAAKTIRRTDGQRWLRHILSLRVDPRDPMSRTNHTAMSELADADVYEDTAKPRPILSSSKAAGWVRLLASSGMRMRTNGDVLINPDHHGFKEMTRKLEIDRSVSLREVLLGAEGVSQAPRGTEITLDGDRCTNPLLWQYRAWRGDDQLEEQS